MRKVTREVCQAFIDGRCKSRGNTWTDGVSLCLHGNRIAWKSTDGAGTTTLRVTMCGWGSVTTRERLNGLCELLGLDREFYQVRGEQYYLDKQIATDDVVTLLDSDRRPLVIRSIVRGP